MHNWKYALLISLVTVGLAGCNSGSGQANGNPVVSAESTAATTFNDQTKTDAQQIDPVTENAADSVSILELHIEPSMVECEGFQVQQCFLVSDANSDEPTYFYESINGFDYQWGHSYTLMVARTETNSQMADVSSYSYDLINIISQGPYQAGQTVDYTTRHASSINKQAAQQYQLNGNTSFTCESSVCDALESVLLQEQHAQLLFQYPAEPSAPLVLLGITCAESPAAFNTAC